MQGEALMLKEFKEFLKWYWEGVLDYFKPKPKSSCAVCNAEAHGKQYCTFCWTSTCRQSTMALREMGAEPLTKEDLTCPDAEPTNG